MSNENGRIVEELDVTSMTRSENRNQNLIRSEL